MKIVCWMVVSFIMVIGCSDNSVSQSEVSSARQQSRVSEYTKFGVAIAAPAYNPNGVRGPGMLHRSARDMHMLGYKAIKLWLNAELFHERTSVIPADKRGHVECREGCEILESPAYVDPLAILKSDEYQKVLALGFNTFVFFPDSLIKGANIWGVKRSQPFSAREKEVIYQTQYDVADYLIKKFKKTGKQAILQNHEGDWHLVEAKDIGKQPGSQQIENMKVYLQQRQKAVSDARTAHGVGVETIAHMCEVVDVVRSRKDPNHRSITNQILPEIECDLIGYSTWDSAGHSVEEFRQSFDYLRQKSRPTAAAKAAFGGKNIVVSEIGYGENEGELQAKSEATMASIRHAVEQKVPFIFVWGSYDNECRGGSFGESIDPNKSVRQNECKGVWTRKPDGSISRMYQEILPLMRSNEAAYVKRAYKFYHSRAAQDEEVSYWVDVIKKHGIGFADKEIRSSPEAKRNFVESLYQSHLGRKSDPAGKSHYLKLIDDMGGNWSLVANQFVDGAQGELSQRKVSAPKTSEKSADKVQTSPAGSACRNSVKMGEALGKGEKIDSCNKRFSLHMQSSDGNLVIYDTGSKKAIWASNTGGAGGASVVQQGDGNLVMYHERSKGHAVWSSGTHGHPGASLVMQDDGNLVIYSKSRKPLWASNTGGR